LVCRITIPRVPCRRGYRIIVAVTVGVLAMALRTGCGFRLNPLAIVGAVRHKPRH